MSQIDLAKINAAQMVEMTDDERQIHLMDHPDSTEEVPVLDMGPYLSGTPDAAERLAQELRQVTETIGFFYLSGHGIPEATIAATFEQSRRFHALPEETKSKIPYVSHDSFMSGYQAIGTPRKKKSAVNIIADAKPNLLSKFSVNKELSGQSVNIWPEDLPGFRETVSDYHARIEALGRQLLPLWAISLGLPSDWFDRFFETPHLTLSLLHYPPQNEIGNRQYGIAPHTDNSFMTLLAQSNVGGLAVRMPSGHWKLVEKKPGTLLINTGNLMVRWTNARYLSTKHRVINTAGTDRYSLPVFFGPSADAIIECAPTCCTHDNPAKYEPITYRNLRQWYYGSYD
jgi:isopenicillin N synthase-like dioxygenase